MVNDGRDGEKQVWLLSERMAAKRLWPSLWSCPYNIRSREYLRSHKVCRGVTGEMAELEWEKQSLWMEITRDWGPGHGTQKSPRIVEESVRRGRLPLLQYLFIFNECRVIKTSEVRTKRKERHRFTSWPQRHVGFYTCVEDNGVNEGVWSRKDTSLSFQFSERSG